MKAYALLLALLLAVASAGAALTVGVLAAAPGDPGAPRPQGQACSEPDTLSLGNGNAQTAAGPAVQEEST